MLHVISRSLSCLTIAALLAVLTGCPDSVIPISPTADFEATPSSGNIPLYAAFRDMSTRGTAPITEWTWDFGDDSAASHERNPNHTYQIPGTYTVSLRVRASDGREDTEIKEDYINATIAAPTADFSADPISGTPPLTVQFTDISTPGTAAIQSWSWTFGDDGSSTEQHPVHTYTTPDTYNVSLRVVSPHGEDTTTKLDFITVNVVPPTAAFSADQPTGFAPQWVHFTDESEVGTSPITSWLWDFADGTYSTEQNPVHLYEDARSYTVSLTVSNETGDSTEQKEEYIVLEESPVALASIPTGWFEMGARADDGDATEEMLPRHYVNLTAYNIGVYEVTNAEFAATLNWAREQEGYIEPTGGNVHTRGKLVLYLSSVTCPIVFEGGVFSPKAGMEDHPVVEITWYGAAAYCNWLSEQLGLTPCYDLDAWERIEPLPNGFRLPTEAEWERAAGWDPSLDEVILPEWETGGQWLYGFTNDEILITRCNYGLDNPLGLSNFPYTTPVGYYDGVHVDTEDSKSPAGCYDMSGNAGEWVHDRYQNYTAENQTNPIGSTDPDAWRVWRGGSWSSQDGLTCRSAYRSKLEAESHFSHIGFRVAR